jgi:hypothetical protein
MDAETFVPNAMTVHLYADEGQGIPAINVMEILRHRGRQSVRTIAGGQTIKEFWLTPLTPNQYETELGAVQAGETVCFVGYDAPVPGNTAYTLCAAGCDPGKGEHNCLGVFGLLNGVTELHLLVCLDELVDAAEVDEEATGPQETGDAPPDLEPAQDDTERRSLPWEIEPEHYDRIVALAKRITDALGYTPETDQMATYDSQAAEGIFDALPYEDQAKLMTVEPVQRWSYIRYARKNWAAWGDERFRTWCGAQEPWVRDIYLKDPNGVGRFLV